MRSIAGDIKAVLTTLNTQPPGTEADISFSNDSYVRQVAKSINLKVSTRKSTASGGRLMVRIAS
jgi:hypothetical protein